MTSKAFFSPPTPEEIRAFKADPAESEPDTCEKGKSTLRHSRDAAFNGITDGLIGTMEDKPVYIPEDHARRL